MTLDRRAAALDGEIIEKSLIASPDSTADPDANSRLTLTNSSNLQAQNLTGSENLSVLTVSHGCERDRVG